MSETELLEAFKGPRSEEAFADLVRRYAGLVYSTAKRRLGNAALAEDITQMVFIRFANKPPRALNQAEFAAWLHRTTVNVTIDLWRSETRRRARELQAVVMESATPQTAVWEDISPKLDDALNQLKDEDRQALLLRFFSRKTMREVGAALGVSEDAAKMRVSRAVERLRIQLGVGATAYSAAVLGTMLVAHAVEAVPSQLVTRLSALKLPAAATGGLLSALMQGSKWQLAAGAAVLTVIALSTVRLILSLDSPIPQPASPNHQVVPDRDPARDMKFGRFSPIADANALNPTGGSSLADVKMLFHVVDARTSEPLAGTAIHMAYFGAGGQGHRQDFLTDDSGTAILSEPADMPMNVFVVASNHVPESVQFRNARALPDFTIKLDPAKTVGGLVVNQQRQPVAAVQITIQTPGIKPGQTENVDFQTSVVTSDEQGHWEYSYFPMDYTNMSWLPKEDTNIPPEILRAGYDDTGMIPFILKREGYAGTVVNVPAAKMDLDNLILMIDRGYTVAGRVADSQNRPISGAEIKALDGDPNKRQSTKTAQDGTFRLSGCSCNNMTGPKWTYQQTVIETNDSGAIIAESGHSFYGYGGFTTVTNDGNVDMIPHYVPWPEKAPQPQVTVAVQAEGFASQTRTVTFSDNTNVTDFKLSPGNIFRGRVVDEAANPIPNAIVQTDWDFKNQIPTHYDWTSQTDKHGQFEWDSAPAEEICYWFEANGYSPIRGLPLPANGSNHVITLKSKVVK